MRFTSPLDRVAVASPCSANWDTMVGDDRVRFCQQCNLNVYNLTRMTRDEAESLVVTTEGRLCVRFYRRADGSVLTRDCPIGLAAIRRRHSMITRAVFAVVTTFLAGIGFNHASAILSSRLLDALPLWHSATVGRLVVSQGEAVLDPPKQIGLGQIAVEPKGKPPTRPRRRMRKRS